MPVLIIYLIKFSVTVSVLYLFYFLFLRRLTFYRMNRLYLAAYAVLSFFIPLPDVSGWMNTEVTEQYPVLYSIPSIESYTKGSANIQAASTSMDPWLIVQYLFLVGVCVMLFRLVMQYLSFR